MKAINEKVFNTSSEIVKYAFFFCLLNYYKIIHSYCQCICSNWPPYNSNIQHCIYYLRYAIETSVWNVPKRRFLFAFRFVSSCRKRRWFVWVESAHKSLLTPISVSLTRTWPQRAVKFVWKSQIYFYINRRKCTWLTHAHKQSNFLHTNS